MIQRSLVSMVDELPPSDLSAEQAVLGSVLLDPTRMDELVSIVEPVHFYDDANRLIFGTMLAMHEAGIRIDPILLVKELRTAAELDLVGVPSYLSKLANSTPNWANARWYADQVRSTWAQREIRERCITIAGQAGQQTPKASIEALGALADSVIVGSRAELVSSSDAVAKVRDRFHSPDRFGVATGHLELDELTGGLRPNQLTILAAATSVGKSAFAIDIAHRVAQSGKRVLYVSLEMTADEIIENRLLPRYSQTSRRQNEILDDIADLPIEYADSPGLSVTNIRGLAKLMRAQGGLDLLIVDYLGLIHEKGRNDYERTTAISRKLMQLPKELEVPVLALAQVNREPSKTSDDKMSCPKLNHLRDSGALEQDAHNVWILHRETRLSEDAVLVVAKQRNGPVSKIKFHFDLKHQTFEVNQMTAWKP